MSVSTKPNNNPRVVPKHNINPYEPLGYDSAISIIHSLIELSKLTDNQNQSLDYIKEAINLINTFLKRKKSDKARLLALKKECLCFFNNNPGLLGKDQSPKKPVNNQSTDSLDKNPNAWLSEEELLKINNLFTNIRKKDRNKNAKTVYCHRALSLIDELLQKYSNHSFLLTFKAECYYFLNKKEELKILALEFPNNFDILKFHCLSLSSTEEIEASAHLIKNYIFNFPTSLNAKQFLIKLYESIRRTKKAEEVRTQYGILYTSIGPKHTEIFYKVFDMAQGVEEDLVSIAQMLVSEYEKNNKKIASAFLAIEIYAEFNRSFEAKNVINSLLKNACLQRTELKILNSIIELLKNKKMLPKHKQDAILNKVHSLSSNHPNPGRTPIQ